MFLIVLWIQTGQLQNVQNKILKFYKYTTVGKIQDGCRDAH